MIKLTLYFGLALLVSNNAAANDINGRILGGRFSQPEDAFCVTIYSIPTAGGTNAFLTSGVAISPKLVLGTGQAIETFQNRQRVRFAEHKIGYDHIDVEQQKIAHVDAIRAHGRYRIDTLEFNIAAFHLADNLISKFIPYTNVGNIPMPFAVKVLGYGSPSIGIDYSDTLLTTIAGSSEACAPQLNNLVFNSTNRCIRSEQGLAQGDQGGAVTNSWLTPDAITLFALVSYWTTTIPNLLILTDLKHPDIESFILAEIERSYR